MSSLSSFINKKRYTPKDIAFKQTNKQKLFFTLNVSQHLFHCNFVLGVIPNQSFELTLVVEILTKVEIGHVRVQVEDHLTQGVVMYNDRLLGFLQFVIEVRPNC